MRLNLNFSLLGRKFHLVSDSDAQYSALPLRDRILAMLDLLPADAELNAHFSGAQLTCNLQRLQIAREMLYHLADDLNTIEVLNHIATQAEAESKAIKLF